MAKKKQIKRICSQTSCENFVKADSVTTKILTVGERGQGEKQDNGDCTCGNISVRRRIFLLDCFCPCRGREPTQCPVHPNVQTEKGKGEQRENCNKEQEKKVNKKSEKPENETQQKESLLQNIKLRLFKRKTPDQADADQFPETAPPAEGKLLTDQRNEESAPPQLTEEIVPLQATKEIVPPKATKVSAKYKKRGLKKRKRSAVPQVQEKQSGGDNMNSYWWSQTDEPIDDVIFNAENFEIPGVPRRETDRGSLEDWIKLRSILMAGLAMGDHHGVKASTNEELPIWQRKRTRHIPRLY